MQQQPVPSQPATPGQPPTPSSAPPPGAPCRGSCSGGQLHRGQLQPAQLPGLDPPSSEKTSVLQPWREYPWYSLLRENHTPSCGKTTVLRFSRRRDATTYNGRRKYLIILCNAGAEVVVDYNIRTSISYIHIPQIIFRYVLPPFH